MVIDLNLKLSIPRSNIYYPLPNAAYESKRYILNVILTSDIRSRLIPFKNTAIHISILFVRNKIHMLKYDINKAISLWWLRLKWHSTAHTVYSTLYRVYNVIMLYSV